MGTTCNGTSPPPQQILSLQFRKQNSKYFSKRNTITNRFSHEIQKLKINGTNMYKLILPVEGEREQIKNIQCKFLFSYADMEMCEDYNFKLEDMTRFPIVDVFQMQQAINPQIYHKITTMHGKRRLMKYYNFKSFSDYQFKKGLYELALYKKLKSKSPLQTHFVIYKGEIKQLVMIFKYCYASLHDVLHYRRAANYEWDERQLLLIMKMLSESYMELSQVGIVHRDIRPSNIFFSPIRMVNSGQASTDSNANSTSSQDKSDNNDRFYEFFNLESARIYDTNDIQGSDDHSDILTVKGVPVFTQKSIRQALEKDQHKANYNPFEVDFIGMKNTLLSLINLQPTNIEKDSQLRFRQKNKVKELIKYLSQPHGLTIQKVDIYVGQLLGISAVSKPLSYYRAIKDFYIKELTVCQNIETNLYFNGLKESSLNPFQDTMKQIDTNSFNINSRSNQGQPDNSSQNSTSNNSLASNLTSILAPPSNHSSMSLKSLPHTPVYKDLISEQLRTAPPQQYIQNLYTKTLYDLQMKDLFVPHMLGKLQRNFENNRREENVTLLLKVGSYFQSSGVKENQYYKQAIQILLQLAQQQRIEGFYKDHSKFVAESLQVFKKFQLNQQSKLITVIKSKILKQKAYQQLYISQKTNQTIQVESRINVPYQSNKGLAIRKLIDQSILLSQNSNLPMEQQLELLYSKGQLCFLMKNFQQSESLFMNGLMISENNYKEFKTYHNSNKYKGMFQYGLSLVELANISNNRIQKKPKTLFNIQAKLTKAKQRFSSVSLHPIHVIRCYVALGDLFQCKEDAENSKNNYDRALNLIHAENNDNQNEDAKSSAGQRSISANIELEIIDKLLDVLSRMNYNSECVKYDKLRAALKRELGKTRKGQRKYNRNGKLTDGDNRSSKHASKEQKMINQNTTNRNNLPVITQQEQQHRMFESVSKRLQIPRQDYAMNQQINNRPDEISNLLVNNVSENISRRNNQVSSPSNHLGFSNLSSPPRRVEDSSVPANQLIANVASSDIYEMSVHSSVSSSRQRMKREQEDYHMADHSQRSIASSSHRSKKGDDKVFQF